MTTTATFPETGTWQIDPAHTSIGFTVRHLAVSKVRGRFDAFEGAIDVGDSPGDSSVRVTIDATSLDTGVADRDRHLKSGDFLDVENHPDIVFTSTAVRESGDRYEVDGDLTIRGETRPVTLDMAYGGVVTDPWGNDKAIFSAELEIDRTDWGLTWNQTLETGGLLVGKQVTIQIEAQAQKA